jgi:hypothetical protein
MVRTEIGESMLKRCNQCGWSGETALIKCYRCDRGVHAKILDEVK